MFRPFFSLKIEKLLHFCKNAGFLLNMELLGNFLENAFLKASMGSNFCLNTFIKTPLCKIFHKLQNCILEFFSCYRSVK